MPYNVPTVYLRNVNGVIRSWPDALANLIADTGSYALTGQTANMIIGRRLIANVGTFSLAGQNANLVKYPSAPTLLTPTMTSDGASIAFTGGSFTSLTPQYKLSSTSTWTSIATTSTSPIVYTGLAAGSYDFRVLANGLTTNTSNTVSGGVSVGGGGISFPLANGHFVVAKRAAYAVYPRPDSETSIYARHRKAYYDGVNTVEYVIPVGVSFGSPPYRFTLLSGPSGMTIGSTYGTANYGVIKWTPTGSVTNATVQVLVENNDGSAPVTLTWTVSTSSSTNDFIFVSSSGNDTSGTGSISQPFATLAKAFTQTQRACIYMRSGTHNMPTTSLTFASGSGPVALLGYTGEVPTVNMGTLTNTAPASGFGVNAVDCYMGEFTSTSGSPNASNFRSVWVSALARFTAHAVSFINPVNGSLNTDNPTSFFIEAAGTQKQHLYICDCSEVGRASSGNNNSAGLFVAFTVSNSLFERNYVSGNAGGNMNLKADCYRCTSRYNVVNATNPFIVIDQPNGVQTPGENELCYNTINCPSSWVAGGSSAALVVNFYTGTTSPGTYWVYRNTVNGGMCVRNSNNSNGPFVFENNAVVVSSYESNVPAGLNGTFHNPSWANWPYSTTTNSGSECNGLTSSGIIDTNTMLLAGTYRTNYLGTRGAEIA